MNDSPDPQTRATYSVAHEVQALQGTVQGLVGIQRENIKILKTIQVQLGFIVGGLLGLALYIHFT